MAGMRRGARAVLKYFVPLYVLAVIVQIFLAGEGIFGTHGSPTQEDESGMLDPHRGLGFFLTMPVAALLLIVALLAWLPNKRLRGLTIALPFMLFLQAILGGAGRWGGAFHPLWAFVLLGTLGYVARELWRAAEEPAVEQAPSPVTTGI